MSNDHFDGKSFFNPTIEMKLYFIRLLLWRLTCNKRRWPRKIENEYNPFLPNELSGTEVAITFINHCTFLIQTSKYNIITDPMYSNRASPFSWVGPERVNFPAISLDELPKIDYVLVSHNHYDHLDLPALKKIIERDNSAIVTGLKVSKYLDNKLFRKVIELDWWADYVCEDLKLSFVPAQHFSARTIFDRNKTLWGGFVINAGGKQIFFSGDSGYGPHFKKIQERYKSFELALLPIGTYEPRWFMKSMHMNPEESVKAHLDINAKKSIGMHFGTFQLSDEWIDEPIKELKRVLEKVPEVDFVALERGQTMYV